MNKQARAFISQFDKLKECPGCTGPIFNEDSICFGCGWKQKHTQTKYIKG